MSNEANTDKNTVQHPVINRFKTTRIGMRNIKTALSATFCAVIYLLIDRNPTFACIGSVFGMDNSLTASLRTGGNRLAGTIIGGLIGMLFFYLTTIIPLHKTAEILLLFLGVMLLVYLSQLLCFAGAIQAGAVVFFIVMLNTPQDQYVSYALNRMLDTGVGVSMSILFNLVHVKMAGKGKEHRFGNEG